MAHVLLHNGQPEPPAFPSSPLGTEECSGNMGQTPHSNVSPHPSVYNALRGSPLQLCGERQDGVPDGRERLAVLGQLQTHTGGREAPGLLEVKPPAADVPPQAHLQCHSQKAKTQRRRTSRTRAAGGWAETGSGAGCRGTPGLGAGAGPRRTHLFALLSYFCCLWGQHGRAEPLPKRTDAHTPPDSLRPQMPPSPDTLLTGVTN